MSFTLNKYHQAWDKITDSNFSVQHLAKELKVDFKGLKIYRTYIKDHYFDTLNKIFPHTKSFFSAEMWHLLGVRYYQKFPPRAYEMNAMAQDLPDYLASLKYLPYLVELAYYEWSEFSTYLNSADENREEQKLQKDEFTLSPCIDLKVYNYPINEWVCAQETTKNIVISKKSPHVLIVSRGKDFLCTFTKASELSLKIISLLLEKEKCLREEINLPFSKDQIQQELNFLVKQRIILFNSAHLTTEQSL